MSVRWSWLGLLVLGWVGVGCVKSPQLRDSSAPILSERKEVRQSPSQPVRMAAAHHPQASVIPVKRAPRKPHVVRKLRWLKPMRIAGVDMPRHPSFLRILKRFRESSWGVVYLSLRRHRLYFHTMTRELRRYGVPQGLIFLAGVESGFHPRIHSGKQAVGPWQFIPKTAQRYGLTITPWVDERRNIKKASRAAAKYLRDLYRMFGSWAKAVSAYNCGEHCLARILQRCPNQSMWQIRLNPGCRLSRETTEHVARIYAQLYYWKHPPQGRPMPTFLEPVRYKQVRTPGPVFVEDVANAIGMKPKDLYELNPELSSWTTPPGQRYPLKVPPALVRKTRRYFRQVRRRRTAVWLRSYRVKRRTTLAYLSRRYHIPKHIIEKLNHISGDQELRERSYVVLPMPRRRWRWSRRQKAAVEQFALRVSAFRWMHRPSTRFWETRAYAQRQHHQRTLRRIRRARVALHRRLADERRQARLARRRRYARRSRRSRRRYRSRRGGRRYLSRRQGQVWRQRRRWIADAGKDWASRTHRNSCYRVQRGDSLWRISRKTGLSLRKLRRYNRGIQTLRVGMLIRLTERSCQSQPSQRTSRRQTSQHSRKSRGLRRSRPSRRTTSQRGCYRVRRGDSLWRISRKYRIPLRTLRRLNRGSSTLRVGMMLRLSAGARCR